MKQATQVILTVITTFAVLCAVTLLCIVGVTVPGTSEIVFTKKMISLVLMLQLLFLSLDLPKKEQCFLLPYLMQISLSIITVELLVLQG